MTVQALPVETVRYVSPQVSEFEIELMPQRLCISYAADDFETIALNVGEYQLIRRIISESGHTELTDGVWA
jgi:fructose 1,6-bisphosphatase